MPGRRALAVEREVWPPDRLRTGDQRAEPQNLEVEVQTTACRSGGPDAGRAPGRKPPLATRAAPGPGTAGHSNENAMCGISGYIDLSIRSSNDDLQSTVIKMGAALRHRGPDDSGVWVNSDAGIALIHRRLSILDLSSDGHQPMRSDDGRFVIVFNGEIYNFIELRKKLQPLGHRFRGQSDTEILLAGISQWGLESTLRKVTGMFAFALWDQEERTLYLARDRLGEKPLYYGGSGNVFVFASELKAIRQHPSFKINIDPQAVSLYFRHSYVPDPLTIYEGVFKMLPGTWLKVVAGSHPGYMPTPQSYWSVREIVASGQSCLFTGSSGEATDRLEGLLKKSVAMQMVADVPLGAFLSGGIDSSLVVALMQTQTNRPVKTFTIGFSEASYNEAKHAKAVAKHLGTDHTEHYVTPTEAMAVIPLLPEIYDEPFADSSQIPTYLVSKLAKAKVTVSLSGDGGDELFGGYTRYKEASRLWSRISSVPGPLMGLLARGIRAFSPPHWDKLVSVVPGLAQSKFFRGRAGDRLHKLADLFSLPGPDALYLQMLTHYWEEAIVSSNAETTDLLQLNPGTPAHASGLEFAHRMMLLDCHAYLPGDILAKVDRAAMSVSLETRVPLLDHRVVEFAWRLPLALKQREGQGKWILRQVLDRYVPRKLIERPKMGFGVPIGEWMRGPLREWVESLLSTEELNRSGLINASVVRKKWREHLEGGRNWQYHLWDVLMFQSWLTRWG